jgi:hypothetical protein
MAQQKLIDIAGGQYVTTTVLVDATGVPYIATGGGGGTTAGVVDLLFIDDSGTQFIYRDNGATPPVFTAYTLAGAAYTVGANPVPYSVKNVIVSASALPTGAATAALQSSMSAKLPATLGRSTGATSLSVVPSTDINFPVSAAGYSITQTSVTVTATSAQLAPANLARKFLAWMVIGTADVTIAAGTPAAVFGAGIIYQASGANKQGASEEFPNGAPTNAFQVIAAATGSVVIVWEGV